MEIVAEYPPNIDQIELALGPRRQPGVMFCYGDTIYYPAGKPLPEPLIAHEGVHSKRQAEIGVDAWWDRYLIDPQFRYDEELMAHQVECAVYALAAPDRASRRRYATAAAKRLSGPLYGRVSNFEKARRDLRIAARHQKEVNEIRD